MYSKYSCLFNHINEKYFLSVWVAFSLCEIFGCLLLFNLMKFNLPLLLLYVFVITKTSLIWSHKFYFFPSFLNILKVFSFTFCIQSLCMYFYIGCKIGIYHLFFHGELIVITLFTDHARLSLWIYKTTFLYRKAYLEISLF